MTRLAGFLFAAFITLHTPSGREVFVNADEVMLIQLSDVWSAVNCHSEVTVHDKVICVREYPFEVKRFVEGAKQ